MPESVMIVTGESSGELYGALLARRLMELWPRVEVLGVGGERMRQAGVEVFAGFSSAFGLVEAVSSLREVRRTLRTTLGVLRQRRPEVVVLIDYPDFNFRVGKAARELGIKVLYYVSPQVWAWRRARVREMAGFVDAMAVVLPFEEDIYRESGIPCEFVGHPILDEMAAVGLGKEGAKEALGLRGGMPCLALLPGSRPGELRRLLPLMTGVVRRFRAEFPDWGFVLPLAPNLDREGFAPELAEIEAEGVLISRENAVLALEASEAALVASGTAALQAAFLETPLVVVYRMSQITYLIAKLVIQVKYANLANLILGRMAVPELLQGRANPETVMAELGPLVRQSDRRERMLLDLRAVREMFSGRRPSERVARMVGELAGWAG